jgi:hypothetical protein
VKALGAALVVIGLLGLAFGGIPYTKKETVAEIGGLKMQASEKKTLGLPPLANGAVILIGAVLWFRAGRVTPR